MKFMKTRMERYSRRAVRKKITQEEIAVIEEGMRRFAKLRDFKIDVKGKTIAIYLPDQDMDFLTNYLRSLILLDPSSSKASLKNFLTYSPVMRFVLADEKGRKFDAERGCSWMWRTIGCS